MFEFFQVLQLKHTLYSLTCLHKLANSLVARNVAMIWDNNTTHYGMFVVALESTISEKMLICNID